MFSRALTFLSVLFLVAGIGLLVAVSTDLVDEDEPESTHAAAKHSEEPTAEPTATRQPTLTPTTAAPVDCGEVFSRAEAEALADGDLGAGKPEAFSGLTACAWTSTTTGARVGVLAVPSSEWAKVLPAAVGTLLESDVDFAGRELLDDALELIEEGGTLDDTKACEVFSTMASLQGQPKGTTQVFNYVPDDQAPQGINGQACVNGRYYSVQLVAPGIKKGPKIEARIRAALASALAR
ncbi:hypothetical protein ABIE44_000994 [Marmoricola sp. OAE513]|uniref:hypothetical protein n=1 Tax=Marmoricola sp. OAE513 TaxID=2817894 RepID=UPI001AE752CD